jgi:hypothetical protein
MKKGLSFLFLEKKENSPKKENIPVKKQAGMHGLCFQKWPPHNYGCKGTGQKKAL